MRPLRLYVKLLLRRFMLLESFCKECGRTVHDFAVPDDVWAAVEPFIRHGNVLCYDCFCEACEAAGLPSVWGLIPLDGGVTPRSFYLLVDGQEVHVRGRAPSDPEQLEALRELWRAAFNQVTEKRS